MNFGTFDKQGESTAPLATKTIFDEPAEFAASVKGLDSRYLPTTNDHRFRKFELALESGRLMISTRPPMLFEGAVVAEHGFVGFQLEENLRAKINGNLVSANGIALWKRGTEYRAHQQSHLTHGSLFPAEPMFDRDWPDTAGRVLQTGAVESSRVRSCVSAVMELIRSDPARIANPNVLKSIDNSLIGTLDDVLCTAVLPDRGIATGRYLRICKQAEEYLRESRYCIVSNREVAKACGVNLRTLHNAFISVLGVSARRYVVLHRLWLTRKALLHSNGDDLVKSIALDHGFWHLGRFSSLYHSTFGETPSTTLAKSSSRR